MNMLQSDWRNQDGEVLDSVSGQPDLPRWFAACFKALGGIKHGCLLIHLPDGRVFRAKGQIEGQTGVIKVDNPGMFGRLLRDGDIGFAEGYMDGWWDTPDLQQLLDVLMLNNTEVTHQLLGVSIVRAYERIRHKLRDNSKEQARKNIAHHYDLGNDFYSLWLDETMTYSSAIYDHPGEALAIAQTRKYASMCDLIGVKAGDHILEIGCGWGGFAEYAAKERCAKVTGLTISQAQHDFARARMKKAGLSDQVEIVMRDYREETGQYDGIASIEMFEAVGEKYWPSYFETVRNRLKPDARATLQIITIQDDLFPSYRKGVDFIQKYIFPGGMLPGPSALRHQIKSAGLSVEGSIEFGQSYSDTLRVWYDDFNASWDKISEMGFDERFQRMWNYYLTSCAACFKSGTTDVTQITMSRPS